jgi:hypothetical protein
MSEIDKLIEGTLGITEEDFYAGHSTRFDDLRAVAKAAIDHGYGACLYDWMAKHPEDFEESDRSKRLREITEEEA